MTLQKVEEEAAILEKVLVQGDLSKLSPAERLMHYKNICESLGLNPLTRPFEYITLQGQAHAVRQEGRYGADRGEARPHAQDRVGTD